MLQASAIERRAEAPGRAVAPDGGPVPLRCQPAQQHRSKSSSGSQIGGGRTGDDLMHRPPGQPTPGQRLIQDGKAQRHAVFPVSTDDRSVEPLHGGQPMAQSGQGFPVPDLGLLLLGLQLFGIPINVPILFYWGLRGQSRKECTVPGESAEESNKGR